MTAIVRCLSSALPCFRKHKVEAEDIQEFSLENLLDLKPDDVVSYKEFKEELVDFYGDRLAEEIEERYGVCPDDKITIEEVRQRLIGVAARVKKEDLEDLFYSIIDEEEDFFLCANFISDEEQQLLAQVLKFEDLTDELLEVLISAFRYLPNDEGEPQAIGALLYPINKFPAISKKCKEFHKNLTMIRAFERADHFLQDRVKHRNNLRLRRKLAHSEHLSREIAYGIPLDSDLMHQIDKLNSKKLLNAEEKNAAIAALIEKEIVGTIFPTVNEKGKKVYYVIKSACFQRGLVSFFCAPFTLGQWVSANSAEDSHFPIKAIFRGTWCWNSCKRDITEGIEVGSKTFSQLCGELIDQFERCIPYNAGNVKMLVAGHSLGGVDAMRFAALIAKVRAERLKERAEIHESKIDKIDQVDVVTFNSPGLLIDTCIEYNRDRRKISESAFQIKFKHVHVKVGEDFFQNFGRALLGWVDKKWYRRNIGVGKILNEDTKIVKFFRNDLRAILGTTWKAHRLPCLSVDSNDPEMKVYKGHLNQKLGPRNFKTILLLIFQASCRRMKRLPSSMKSVTGKQKKEFKKNISRIFKQRAIRSPRAIFEPDLSAILSFN